MTELKAQMPGPVRGVILDVDGTAADTETIVPAVIQTVAAQHGCCLRSASFGSMRGKDWRSIAGVVQEAAPANCSVDSIMRESDAVLRAGFRRQPPPIKTGLDELLAFLDDHNIPRATATSADREWMNIVLGGRCRQFQATVTREEVAEAKPAPEAFFAAAAQLGIAPEHFVVIGDSSSDMLGARRAGMTPFYLDGHGPPGELVLNTAHRVVTSLREFGDFLKKLLP